MEEVLPFRCVNLTIYSAKKTKQNKTKMKKKKKYRMRDMLECKQIGRLDMQSMDVRKSKRERERKDCEV